MNTPIANESHAVAPGDPRAHGAPAWRFDHVNVSMGSSHALRELFEGVMGFQSGYRPPFPFPGLWLYSGNQAVVHAVDDASLPARTGALRFGHIAFSSAQPASQLIERLRGGSIPFRVARIPQDRVAQIFVLLPGDLVVELDVPDDTEATEDYVYGAAQTVPDASDF